MLQSLIRPLCRSTIILIDRSSVKAALFMATCFQGYSTHSKDSKDWNPPVAMTASFSIELRRR